MHSQWLIFGCAHVKTEATARKCDMSSNATASTWPLALGSILFKNLYQSYQPQTTNLEDFSSLLQAQTLEVHSICWNEILMLDSTSAQENPTETGNRKLSFQQPLSANLSSNITTSFLLEGLLGVTWYQAISHQPCCKKKKKWSVCVVLYSLLTLCHRNFWILKLKRFSATYLSFVILSSPAALRAKESEATVHCHWLILSTEHIGRCRHSDHNNQDVSLPCCCAAAAETLISQAENIWNVYTRMYNDNTLRAEKITPLY